MWLYEAPSHLCFHHFFSSDPVWRFCLISLFTYLPLFPWLYLERKRCCCSTHYKSKKNLSAQCRETLSLYLGVCDCVSSCVFVCVCVFSEKTCCPLSPPVCLRTNFSLSLSLFPPYSLCLSVSTREAKHKILSHPSVPWGPHFVY